MSTIEQRIGEISKTHLKASIVAMKKLYRYYNRPSDRRFVDDCPLCPLAGSNKCARCPWVVMTGKSCFGWKNRRLFSNHALWSLRGKRYPRWTTLRLKHLPCWVKAYEIELRRRDLAVRLEAIIEGGK